MIKGIIGFAKTQNAMQKTNLNQTLKAGAHTLKFTHQSAKTRTLVFALWR